MKVPRFTVAAPGTAFGPCADPCRHPHCRELRKIAAALCPFCGLPIGYDTRFVAIGGGVFRHSSCGDPELLFGP